MSTDVIANTFAYFMTILRVSFVVWGYFWLMSKLVAPLIRDTMKSIWRLF